MSLDDYFYAEMSDSVAGTGAADVSYVDVDLGTGLVDLSRFNAAEIEMYVPAPAAGPTTPTLDVDVENSMDGENFTKVGSSFSQVTTAASRQRQTILRTALVNFGRFWRFKCSVATAAGTATYIPVFRVLALHN